MNKLQKILLAILAGIETTFYLFTPVMIAALWVVINGLDWTAYFFYSIALLATLFRAIKIGWMK